MTCNAGPHTVTPLLIVTITESVIVTVSKLLMAINGKSKAVTTSSGPSIIKHSYFGGSKAVMHGGSTDRHTLGVGGDEVTRCDLSCLVVCALHVQGELD